MFCQISHKLFDSTHISNRGIASPDASKPPEGAAVALSDAAVVVGTGTEPKASKSDSSRSAGAEDGTWVGATVGATGEINPTLRNESQSKSTHHHTHPHLT